MLLLYEFTISSVVQLENSAVSHDCLRKYADGPTSHDMLFHSVLGLLDLETVDLRPDLNLTSNCLVKGSVNGA